jgi:hypothetical protein
MGIATTIVGGILAGLVTTGSPAQRILGVSIAAALLVVAAAGEPPPLSYVTLTIAAIVALRVIDLRVERPSRSAARRVLHIFTPFDSRLGTRCRPHLNAARLLETLAWGVLSYVAFKAAANAPESTVVAHYAIRWSLGVLFVLALFETIARSLSVISAMVGVEIPALHDAPYMARSLREFWSARWNKLVGRWLRDHCYAPLAKRGYESLALTASFAASAALHLYIASVLLDIRWGAVMATLFLLQVPLLRAEDVLNIRRRPTVIGRIWTLGVLFILSPLFTEPVLRIFGSP